MAKSVEVYIVTPETAPIQSGRTHISELASAIYANGGHILNPVFLNRDRFDRAMLLSTDRYAREFLEANLKQADIAMGILSSESQSAQFIEDALISNKPVTLFQSEDRPFQVELSRIQTIPYRDGQDLFEKVRVEMFYAKERLQRGR